MLIRPMQGANGCPSWLPAFMTVFFGLLAAAAHGETVFVPVVDAPALHALQQEDTHWTSTLSLTNPTGGSLTFRYLQVLGAQANIFSGCVGSFSVPAQSLFRAEDIGNRTCVHPGGAGVAFLQIDVDPGLVPTAGIHLTDYVGCNDAPGPAVVSVAAVPLPIYAAPFPANATAASSDVSMPRELLLAGRECSQLTAPVSQRVNVTILNAGADAGTATVTAAGTSLPPYIVTLNAGSVTQLNNVFPEADYQVLTISVSQPFLCYASSVVKWSDAARVPSIAVYGFHEVP
jgi:hypothetical protein